MTKIVATWLVASCTTFVVALLGTGAFLGLLQLATYIFNRCSPIVGFIVLILILSLIFGACIISCGAEEKDE